MDERKTNDVIAFLLGEGALDGVWYGDPPPTGKPRFWWRAVLREYAEAQKTGTGSFHLTGAGQSGGVSGSAVWQPIETAPKDRQIMVWNAVTGPYITQHCTSWQTGFAHTIQFEGDGEWPMVGWCNTQGVWFPRPTHWMPVPPAPTKTNDAPKVLLAMDPIPSARDWLDANRSAASAEWIEGWTACRTFVTQRSAEPTRAGTERHTRNEPDPESGISPGSSIPVERRMV